MSTVETSHTVNEHDNTTTQRAWWTLGVLTFVSMLDWADRALMSIVAEPIRHEFNLSDTQLGILMGFAFVAFRVVIAVPVGRLVDDDARNGACTQLCGIGRRPTRNRRGDVG